MKKILIYINVTVLVIITVNGCSSVGNKYREDTYNQKINRETVFQNLPLDTALDNRMLSLDPEHITGKDIKEVLSRYPAPRIINLNGSFPIVTMDSFSRFLIAMGYPEEKILNPKNGAHSYSSYISSKKLAGWIAWYYEKEGMMPILIGHSGGGMKVVKVLHELAGAFNEKLSVWNPLTEEAEDRYSIIDPLTGNERPVVGLKAGYAAAIATGRLMRFILGQWNMLTRLRKIPDTVREFTGFYIKYDLLGSDFLGFGRANKYYPLGSAIVRNVRLPAEYSHITIPLTEHLANNNTTREWINKYIPTTEEPELTVKFDTNSNNILFVADIWYNIKKHWSIELQQLIRAKRERENIDESYER